MLEGLALNEVILVEGLPGFAVLSCVLRIGAGQLPSLGRDIPVIADVTVETTGTMLLGSEIGAALTAVEPLGIDMIGLNCATGPAGSASTCAICGKRLHAGVGDANAGLPVLGANGAEYPLLPDELAEALSGFVTTTGCHWSVAAAARLPNISARSPMP